MTRMLWWALWPLALAIVSFCALWFGATGGGLSDALAAFFGARDGQAGVIATHRLPRTMAAMVVGAHLALAGAILQIVLRNPLADPTILGISGGASFAVVLAMSLAISAAPQATVISAASQYLPLSMVPPIALTGGLLASVLVLALSWDNRTKSFSAQRTLLVGIVVGAMLSAAVMALVLSLSEARTELAIQWLSGSLYARSSRHVWPALPFTLVCGLGLVALTQSLSALRFDPHTARSLGANPDSATPLLILVATGLASSAVAVAGPVGFVGLLAPHIARYLGGAGLGSHLWASACIGALLVVASDLIGRLIALPLEIPVGIVTSLIGAPVFALLLSRSLRSRHVPSR